MRCTFLFLTTVVSIRFIPIYVTGPKLADGESHYQYLMRKKREEAEEAELRRLDARDEQARLREEKLQADWDYRKRLEDEQYGAQEGEEGDEDDAMNDLENMAAGSDDSGSRSGSYSD